MKKFLIITLIFIGFVLINYPSNALTADLEHGKQIFTVNCAVCHAGGENSIMPDKTLKKDVLEDNSMYSISAITYQVKNGKNAMPAFSGRLEENDIEDVANYVFSQSGSGW